MDYFFLGTRAHSPKIHFQIGISSWPAIMLLRSWNWETRSCIVQLLSTLCVTSLWISPMGALRSSISTTCCWLNSMLLRKTTKLVLKRTEKGGWEIRFDTRALMLDAHLSLKLGRHFRNVCRCRLYHRSEIIYAAARLWKVRYRQKTIIL